MANLKFNHLTVIGVTTATIFSDSIYVLESMEFRRRFELFFIFQNRSGENFYEKCSIDTEESDFEIILKWTQRWWVFAPIWKYHHTGNLPLFSIFNVQCSTSQLDSKTMTKDRKLLGFNLILLGKKNIVTQTKPTEAKIQYKQHLWFWCWDEINWQCMPTINKQK